MTAAANANQPILPATGAPADEPRQLRKRIDMAALEASLHLLPAIEISDSTTLNVSSRKGGQALTSTGMGMGRVEFRNHGYTALKSSLKSLHHHHHHHHNKKVWIPKFHEIQFIEHPNQQQQQQQQQQVEGGKKLSTKSPAKKRIAAAAASAATSLQEGDIFDQGTAAEVPVLASAQKKRSSTRVPGGGGGGGGVVGVGGGGGSLIQGQLEDNNELVKETPLENQAREKLMEGGEGEILEILQKHHRKSELNEKRIKNRDRELVIHALGREKLDKERRISEVITKTLLLQNDESSSESLLMIPTTPPTPASAIPLSSYIDPLVAGSPMDGLSRPNLQHQFQMILPHSTSSNTNQQKSILPSQAYTLHQPKASSSSSSTAVVINDARKLRSASMLAPVISMPDPPLSNTIPSPSYTSATTITSNNTLPHPPHQPKFIMTLKKSNTEGGGTVSSLSNNLFSDNTTLLQKYNIKGTFWREYAVGGSKYRRKPVAKVLEAITSKENRIVLKFQKWEEDRGPPSQEKGITEGGSRTPIADGGTILPSLSVDSILPVSKGRGRPRKVPGANPTKKGRGRPRHDAKEKSTVYFDQQAPAPSLPGNPAQKKRIYAEDDYLSSSSDENDYDSEEGDYAAKAKKSRSGGAASSSRRSGRSQYQTCFGVALPSFDRLDLDKSEPHWLIVGYHRIENKNII